MLQVVEKMPLKQSENKEIKRIMHYTSEHKILLVGEGDFSFSTCLAVAFGSGRNMTATAIDSLDKVLEYGDGKQNLAKLAALGCTVLLEVDALSMNKHADLINLEFDRIIYNFPHAGFQFREHEELQIRLHQAVVSGFFKSAQQMLSGNGQVHVTHKTSHPFSNWEIERLATEAGLQLLKKANFYKFYYPGYNNRKGAGVNFDKTFPVGDSDTFMFTKVDQTHTATVPYEGGVICEKVVNGGTFQEETGGPRCLDSLLRASDECNISITWMQDMEMHKETTTLAEDLGNMGQPQTETHSQV